MSNQIKALFAKLNDQSNDHNKLRLSVQGMKTQQGYIRDDVKRIKDRMDPLDTMPKQMEDLRFLNLTLCVSLALFYGTLILGWVMR